MSAAGQLVARALLKTFQPGELLLELRRTRQLLAAQVGRFDQIVQGQERLLVVAIFLVGQHLGGHFQLRKHEIGFLEAFLGGLLPPLGKLLNQRPGWRADVVGGGRVDRGVARAARHQHGQSQRGRGWGQGQQSPAIEAKTEPLGHVELRHTPLGIVNQRLADWAIEAFGVERQATGNPFFETVAAVDFDGGCKRAGAMTPDPDHGGQRADD